MQNGSNDFENQIINAIKPLIEKKDNVIHDILKTFLLIAATVLSVLVSLHNEISGNEVLFKIIAGLLTTCIITGFFSFTNFVSLINRTVRKTVKNYTDYFSGSDVKHRGYSEGTKLEKFNYFIFRATFIASILCLGIYALTL